jgi:hypothetical protein
VRRARVHDHGELLARGHDRGRRNRVRGVDPPRQDVDVVLGEQLLDRDLGVGAAGILHVAPDQRDLVRRHLVGVELEVELHAAINLLRELGADARVRQVDADLHLLGLGPRGRHDEHGGYRDDPLHH